MARIIDRLSNYTPGRKNTWIKDEWFDGRARVIEPADFGARKMAAVRKALHHAAHRKGLKVETRLTAEGMEVKAYR
jgi:hypothetical protein